MKVIICFPPLNSDKGYPTLGQNRQFQYFKEPTFIYPVVPACAATMLKQAGFEVKWLDCIAESISYERFFEIIKEEKPDVIAMETKTPIIKQQWRLLDKLKKPTTNDYTLTTILFGDHVTALPQESFENSQVDFVLTGGNYDFLLLNLCQNLSQLSAVSCQLSDLEPGIWYREGSQIKNTGEFKLNHDLNSLPFIDRELTKWQLYAYKNGNYRRTPGTYIMAGRDCWWGRCSFCLHPDMNIITNQGAIPIKQIVDGNNEDEGLNVLTHTSEFRKINKKFKRFYEGKIIDIEIFNLKQNIKLTSNHKIYALKKNKMKRCSKRNCWGYFCYPTRISSRLQCSVCTKRYYQDYQAEFIAAESLEKNDFLAVPIIRRVKDIKNISVKKILNDNPCFLRVYKKVSDKIVHKIVEYYKVGYSQRKIARLLNVDRETIKRYITLFKENSLDSRKNPLVEEGEFIKFRQGRGCIPESIIVSTDFMRLVGYYLSEGHVSKIKNRPNSYVLRFTFSEKEIQFIDEVVNISRRIFKGVDIRKYRNKVNKTIQINIGNALLYRMFSDFFGKGCYTKKIPHEFLFLPLNKQKELLRGLFRGDGHLRRRNKGESGTEYIYETVSYVLAQQVLIMLFRQNLIPNFRVCKPGKKATVDKYVISLCQYDIEQIFPEIKLSKRTRIFRSGFILGDYACIPIKSIKKENYRGDVYNLEIERDHSYSVNNVAVKNCSWPQLYPEFRVRAAEKVLDEIEYLADKYKVKEIMDDTGAFPVGEWLQDFCHGMIKRRLNKRVNLNCNMRFGAIDSAGYKLMKEAGFRFLLFGLESANQKTLDKINKNLKVETIIESCRQARGAGLYPHITAMFGYPWESYQDACKTLELAKWLLKKDYAYTMQATVVIPYPRTPLFKECEENDLLLSLDWDDYDMKCTVMKLNFSSDELLKLVRSLYSVSFNPEFILRKVLSIRDIDDVKYFSRAFMKVLGHIRGRFLAA